MQIKFKLLLAIVAIGLSLFWGLVRYRVPQLAAIVTLPYYTAPSDTNTDPIVSYLVQEKGCVYLLLTDATYRVSESRLEKCQVTSKYVLAVQQAMKGHRRILKTCASPVGALVLAVDDESYQQWRLYEYSSAMLTYIELEPFSDFMFDGAAIWVTDRKHLTKLNYESRVILDEQASHFRYIGIRDPKSFNSIVGILDDSLSIKVLINEPSGWSEIMKDIGPGGSTSAWRAHGLYVSHRYVMVHYTRSHRYLPHRERMLVWDSQTKETVGYIDAPNFGYQAVISGDFLYLSFNDTKVMSIKVYRLSSNSSA